jgi:2,4-dichlorophenol 6-monooxygenase
MKADDEVKVPVLIVGGGGCGLSSSFMLSNLGIKHVLVEAYSATAHIPKASFLNQRTAEVTDQHGI